MATRTNVLGAATSTGSIETYTLSDQSGTPRIEHVRTIQYFSEDVLITAFAWHPESWSVAMTLTTGQVYLGNLDLSEASETPQSVELATHDLEAWTLAFIPDGSGIYSGGDDSALRFIEVPMNLEYHRNFAVEPEYGARRWMSWADKKIHSAGVTAILPLEADQHGARLLTGSYDDHIRLVHIPMVGRRTILAEMNLGGGVWRLKRLNPASPSMPSRQYGSNEVVLLVSCMYAGVRVIRLYQDDESQWQFEILAKFEEHKSMNYGSDCQVSPNGKGQRTFITTSFYDRLLCLWRY